ncbi:Gamma-glutamyl phosphate reductase [Leifsonia rubra CMS 76R]|nr:Gamma-glutamyl phosphate reductase [Leifsonia rubra CMS 76R]
MVDSAVIGHTIAEKLTAARAASRTLSTLTTVQKNAALAAIARDLTANAEQIIAANELDSDRGRNGGMAEGLQDRLRLTHARIEQLSEAVREIIELPDPVGTVVRGAVLPNGLSVSQVRVPFGVIGAIYEARPNVTIDIAALALKSGNAVVLRGGSAAEESNRVLVEIIQAALRSVGVEPTAVQTVDEFGRDGAQALMRARGFVDVLIPRGSAQLIQTVVDESTVPVIETGAGVVHVFLDESADETTAIEIVHNAKVQRPSVCNALETLLVHEAAAERLIPGVLTKLAKAGVTIHADERTRELFPECLVAGDDAWGVEHLSLDIAVRVVADLDAAIDHITTYSTKHTESIITNDLVNADRFLAEVDSAVVMVNASTRFTDGAEFGFGAEVGISTQKLHARGPMGLPELTSTKWVVRGSGQVRG